MEFWGLVVQPGTTVKCVPEDDYILHLSQAALGESKKASDNATIYVKVGDQKLAIGTLSADKYPQIQFDLVFEKEFELSHTSKAASVFFSGYKVHQPVEGDEMDPDSEEDEDEEEEEMQNPLIKENGKAQGKEQKSSKASATVSKADAIVEKTKNNDDSDEDETDDSDEDDDLSPDESDDDGSSHEDDSTEENEESEETPKKPESGKKRVAENVLKTPASDKKAKVSTPSGQKIGDKKSTHVATPHPAKQTRKTSANNDKSPKSGQSVSCKSCSKTFNSEMALQAHAKAKKH